MKRAAALGTGLLLSAAACASAGGNGGDPTRGEVAYQKCYACHALEPGKNDLSGPTLYAIVGRRIAAESGFDYSPALRSLARREARWSEELLDRYIADPGQVAPGTTMGFFGMRDERERADLIAFLQAKTAE